MCGNDRFFHSKLQFLEDLIQFGSFPRFLTRVFMSPWWSHYSNTCQYTNQERDTKGLSYIPQRNHPGMGYYTTRSQQWTPAAMKQWSTILIDDKGQCMNIHNHTRLSLQSMLVCTWLGNRCRDLRRRLWWIELIKWSINCSINNNW